MLTEKEILNMLQNGATEDEIAELLSRGFNDAVEKFKQEKEAKAKAEQEKKEKAAALDQARDVLVDALVAYLKADGYEFKGDMKKTLTKYIKKTEEGIFDFWKFI